MSLTCDVCGSRCIGNNHASVTAWWGKQLERLVLVDKDDDRYTVRKLDQESGLAADICRTCLETHLMQTIRFSPSQDLEELRKEQLNQWLQEHPGASWAKAARLNRGFSIDNIACDVCQQDCFEKHLAIQTKWQNAEGKTLEAALCETCSAMHLNERVQLHLVKATVNPTSPIQDEPLAPLAALLRQKGKTVRDVMKALKVSERTVFYWIAGERQPELSIAQIQSLCKLLDCSVHELPVAFGNPQKQAQANT